MDTPPKRWYLQVSDAPNFQMASLLRVASLLYGWFWNQVSVAWSEMPLGSSWKLLMRHLNDLWWIDYPTLQDLILKSHISAVNSMEHEGTPNQCRFTVIETNRETSQWHCECQLTSPCGIARLRIGGVRIAGRQLKKIYLQLALACEGGEGYEKGTKEIKDR